MTVSSVPDAHWSDEQTEMIAESSRDHFIDRYNREIVLNALAGSLQKPGATFMDIGCAAGYLLEEAAARFPHAHLSGSDYFSEGFKASQERLPGVSFLKLDATQTELPSGHFDALSSLNVLEHIQDDQKALREMARLLKPGGLLAITVPAGPNLFDLYDEVHSHQRRYDKKSLQGMIHQANLTLLRINYFGVLIYPAFYLQKRWNQIRYRNLSMTEKKAIVHRLMHNSQRWPLMERLSRWEMKAGETWAYPFGIRLFALAQKPA